LAGRAVDPTIAKKVQDMVFASAQESYKTGIGGMLQKLHIQPAFGL
jgi:hypothetical protein